MSYKNMKEGIEKFTSDVSFSEPGFVQDVGYKDVFYAMKEYIRNKESNVFWICLGVSVFFAAFSFWNFWDKQISEAVIFAILSVFSLVSCYVIIQVMRQSYIHTDEGKGYMVPKFMSEKISLFLNSIGKQSALDFLSEYHRHNLFAMPYKSFEKQCKWIESYFALPENERNLDGTGLNFVTTMLLCFEQQVYKDLSGNYQDNPKNSEKMIKAVHNYIERENFRKSV